MSTNRESMERPLSDAEQDKKKWFQDAVKEAFGEAITRLEKHMDKKMEEHEKNVVARFESQKEHVDKKIAEQEKNVDAWFESQKVLMNKKLEKYIDKKKEEQEKNVDARLETHKHHANKKL